MSTTYNLVYKKARKEELITIRKHLRSYYTAHLRGMEAHLPKLDQEGRTILLENWQIADVENAIAFSNRSLGTGQRPLQPDIEEVKYEADVDSQETENIGNIQKQDERNAPSRFIPPTLPTSDYALLVTGDVLDLLGGIDPKRKEQVKEFLSDLSSKGWEEWSSTTNGFQCWSNDSSKRNLFSRAFEGVGTFIWERLQTVYVLRVMNYPTSAYDATSADGDIMRPHVVIYELREDDTELGDILTFQNSIYSATFGLNNSINYVPSKGEDQLTYGEELYLLSPSRISDVLSGVQKGLPLHLAEEQANVLNAPGPVLLSGEAGSGKTNVIVQWLVMNHMNHEWSRGESQESLKQLFVTYSERLRDKAQLEFNRMLPRKHKDHRTIFKTYRQIVDETIQRAGIADRFPKENFINLEQFIRRFSNKTDPGVDPFLLWDEIRSAIKGTSNGETGKFIDVQRYKDLNEKKGRCKTPQRLRELYYADAVKYRSDIEANAQWDMLDLVQTCFAKKTYLPKFDRIACDEVQDLAIIEILLLIQMLSSQSVQDLFLAGDVAQVINPSGFTWARLKGNLWDVGNEASIPDRITFNRNYRSSQEIVEIVNDVLTVRNQVLDDEVGKMHQIGLVSGEHSPGIVTHDPLRVMETEQTNPDKRLVLVKTQSEKLSLLEKLGDSALSQTILTVDEAKGLEWEGILLYNFFIPRHDSITKNDWWEIFDQEHREKMAAKISSGETNPYGLTYEFNILHVGLTRAKRILAFYDADTRMSISNLGTEISNRLENYDLEAFSYIWKTEPPKAEDWQNIGEKLLDRDSEQAWKFLNKAGNQFQKDGRYLEAAACFEKSLSYKRAFECYKAIGDEAEEFRVLSQQAQMDGDFKEAGNLLVKRAKSLFGSGKHEDAKEVYYEAESLYEFSKEPKLAVEAALLRLELISPLNHKERAQCLDRISVYYRDSGDDLNSISSLDKAITEAESISETGARVLIESDPRKVWIAIRYSQKAELLNSLKDLGEAANAARRAAGTWMTAASEYEENSFDRRRSSDNGRDWFARAIELYISSGKFALAGATRKELKGFVNDATQINWIRNAWNSFMSAYVLDKDTSEYAETLLELTEMLTDRNQHSLAIEIVKEGLSYIKKLGEGSLYGAILSRSLDILYGKVDTQSKIELLTMRGDWFESQDAFEDAFNDFKNASKFLFEVKENDRGKSMVDRAKKCATRFMNPFRVGRFLVVDIVCEYYIIAGLELEKVYTTQDAASYFIQDFDNSIRGLDGLIRKKNEEIEALEVHKQKTKITELEVDIEKQLSSKRSTLGWFELSKYETITRSKSMKGVAESEEDKALLSKVFQTFESANNQNAINSIRTKYNKPMKI